MTRRQTLLWRCAVHHVTYLYADAWLRNSGMAHAKFKVAVHLRQLEARLGRSIPGARAFDVEI